MPVPVTYNGTTYQVPVQGDRNWAPPLTRYLVALASGSLQLTGGNFTLLADVNFGPNFGLLSKYFTSAASNPATAGVLRLAKTDAVEWRNNANNGNLALTIDGTDQLNFNGIPLAVPSVLTQNHVYVGNASNQPANVAMSGDATIVASGALTIANGAITDTKVNASAAIAVTKLAALTANKAVASDSSGFLTASSTTDTELGYVHGVTSAIQTQINNVASISAPSGAIIMYGGSSAPAGWLLCDGTSYLRATYPNLFTAIGTTFGSADGTHFNVPQMTDNVPIGSGSIAALGATAGSATHTLTVAEIPAGLTVTDPGHMHVEFALGLGGAQTNLQFSGTANPPATTTGTNTGSNTTGISVGGGGTAHSIVQPVLGVTYIIKT